MRRLLQPLSYLAIRHTAKWRYDYAYPAVLAALITAILLWGPVDLNVSGDKGLLDKLNGLIGILVGFFIAALAAVATFDRPGMDEVMPGEAPKLMVVERGARYEIALSRRIFLSMLFGYLSLVSFFVYVAGVVIQLASQDGRHIPAEVFAVARPVVIFPYLFLVCNVAINTALGIYYLSYRIHDLTSKIIRIPTND